MDLFLLYSDFLQYMDKGRSCTEHRINGHLACHPETVLCFASGDAYVDAPVAEIDISTERMVDYSVYGYTFSI